MDPLTRGYPMLTPYQFASNRPIDGVDLDGLEYIDSDKISQFVLDGQIDLQSTLDISKYVEFEGKRFMWLGYDVYDGLSIETEWLNGAFSNTSLDKWQGTFEGYPSIRNKRDAGGECHVSGCCIDCFNLAVDNTFGIKESELTDANNQTHPHRIDYTVDQLRDENIVIDNEVVLTPNIRSNKDGSFTVTGFQQDVETAMLSFADGIKGNYIFAVSVGEGYHALSVRMDYTNEGPTFYWMDQKGLGEDASDHTEVDSRLIGVWLRNQTRDAIKHYIRITDNHTDAEGNFSIPINTYINKIESPE